MICSMKMKVSTQSQRGGRYQWSCLRFQGDGRGPPPPSESITYWHHDVQWHHRYLASSMTPSTADPQVLTVSPDHLAEVTCRYHQVSHTVHCPHLSGYNCALPQSWTDPPGCTTRTQVAHQVPQGEVTSDRGQLTILAAQIMMFSP